MENTKPRIYLDNAATTPVSKPVFEAMLPFLTEHFGNPSSLYSEGRNAKAALESARTKIAELLGCQPSEIFFTSGGTESDNWAIKGAAAAGAQKGKRHIITSVFEHHAVLHTTQWLEKQGYEVTYLPVDSNGVVKAEQIEEAIRPDTALVTIMYANNEIGTIQPVEQIAGICREKGVVFHTDAVQAVGNIPIDLSKLPVDLLSVSGHKIHSPKGIGLLFCRRGVRIPNLIEGGAQENKRRAGTENVAFAVAISKALELATSDLESRAQRVLKLREKYLDGILNSVPKVRLNGDRVRRLPGNANISIEGIEGESLILMLDAKGIAASSGSACTSGSLDPSHVLLSLGLSHELAHGSLRLSFSDENTEQEVDYVLEVLPEIIVKLRQMSPLWEKIKDK